MKQLIVYILLLINFSAPAQITRSPLSAGYTGIGVYSRHFSDAFSGTVNQAALAAINIPAAAIYGERRFMLKDLSNYAAALAIPSGLGGFGIGLKYFGGENFSSSEAGLAYGKKLSDKIAIGLQFNYNMMRVPGYGNSSTVNFEVGALLQATDKLCIGLHMYNPAGGRFGIVHTEKLASVYTTGLGYEVSRNFFTSIEITKEEDRPVNVNAGMQYIFAAQFFARAGVATGSSQYFFGVGVKWNLLRVDIVTTCHPQLGFTPAVMFLFDFRKNKEQQGQ